MSAVFKIQRGSLQKATCDILTYVNLLWCFLFNLIYWKKVTLHNKVTILQSYVENPTNRTWASTIGSSGEEKPPLNWRSLSSTRPADSAPWPLSQCASSSQHCVTNPESDSTARWWCLSVFILTVCICHCTHWQPFQCHRSWPQRCNNLGNLHRCQPLTLWALKIHLS